MGPITPTMCCLGRFSAASLVAVMMSPANSHPETSTDYTTRATPVPGGAIREWAFFCFPATIAANPINM